MTASKKVAQKRLTLLQVAERLRNVSEACRLHRVSRSQFYEYKRAFQERGLDGLLDQPPIPKSFPRETPEEARGKVIEVSVAHPLWGQTRVADQLRLEGVSVSPSTVRNIWIKEGLETRYKRILRFEESIHGSETELTEEHIRLLEKANPSFKERHVESPYPGYLLCQDTFMVGTIKGIGRIYLQAVIDTYSSYGFGKMYTSKMPETVVDVLYDRVLPFYESHGIVVEHILTDNGREYCGREMVHPYEIFLDLNDIVHRRTKVATPRTNGFVERFNRTVLDEFVRTAFREKFYTSVDELQTDFDTWLTHYNTERPHRGYRNMGRRPAETIEIGKEIRQQLLTQNEAA